MRAQVVIHEAATRRWLAFDRAHTIIRADTLSAVAPALREVEAAVQAGAYAAGLISYEAAPAFDAGLAAHPPDGFPLVWFGLFAAPTPLPALPEPPATEAYTLGPWQATLGPAAYAEAIARIKDHIARGETYQVNYTYRLRADFAGDPWALFLQLAHAQRADYAAYLDLGTHAVCSASPELFFEREGARVRAKPMKGTHARGRTLAEDEAQARWLQASEKNRAENVMIVDMLRNDLGRVAETGSVRVPALFEAERYPTLWQMTSTVTAEVRRPLTELLAALFPCASITGAPKHRTMQIIRELEPTPRHSYCGAIGLLTPAGRAQFNVAIRTALIDRAAGQAEYGVGSGVVWDSEAEAEYAECQLKARVLHTRRPRFDLLESLRWTPEAGYWLLERHLGRLAEAAVYFGVPLTLAEVRARLTALAATLPPAPHKVRLLVAPSGAAHVEAAALPPAPAGAVRLALAAAPISAADPFLFHKTTHRIVYEQARAAHPEADDVLLWNEAGEVTEACLSNLAVRCEGRWWTPPVAAGLLAGVYRAELLAQGVLRERVLTVAETRQAEALAVINSVRGWRPAQLLAE